MPARGLLPVALLALLAALGGALPASGDGDVLASWVGERGASEGLGNNGGSTRRHLDTARRRGKGKFRMLQAIPEANPGLPSTCMTYHQRYAAYMDGSQEHPDLEAANRRNPHSKFVVVLQMHHSQASHTLDMVLAARALAREVQELGFHFYILHQVPTKQLALHPEEVQDVLTREEMLALVPADLRGVTIFHDVLEEFRAYYPKVQQRAAGNTDWGPGPRGLLSGISLFMHRYRSYEFGFSVECDVRLPGSHWGQFLVAALHQGIRAEGTDANRSEGVRFERPIATELPTVPVAGLPDLLAFDAIAPDQQWAPSQIGFNETDKLENMRAMIYGGSRRLYDALHELLLEGRSMYLESLLPAIPRLVLKGGKAVAIRVPKYGESYHCCIFDGTELYAAWFKAQAQLQCLPLVLIHPVKNLEPFWPVHEPLA